MGILDAIWFLVWTNINEAPDHTHPLCKPIPGVNSCPFPPMVSDAGAAGDVAIAAATFNLANYKCDGDASFCWKPKYRWKTFKLATIVPSPSVTFSDDGISAVATATAAVYGVNQFTGEQEPLVVAEMDLSIPIDTPSYDVDTGKFSGLKLGDITVSQPRQIEVHDHQGYVVGQEQVETVLALLYTGVNVLMSTVVIPPLNFAIELVLQTVPFNVPVLKRLPLKTQDLHINPTSAIIDPRAGTATTQGYFHVAAGISVQVTEHVDTKQLQQ